MTSPSTPRWPTVVFDLDGTLADTLPLIIASYQHTFRTVLGHEEDPDRIRTWIGRTLPEIFTTYYRDHADELLATYLEWNDAHTEDLIRGFDGVRDVLADLSAAGLALGVATSKRRASARQAMDLLGLSEHLPVLVAMEDVETHKPDPAPLLLAVERLGGDPAAAVYVGDAVVDVRAGQAAGMATAAVTWGAALVAAGPDALVDEPGALRALLLH